MFEYLDCLIDGLRTLGGERIRVPERRRFDPDDSCMFSIENRMKFFYLFK
jgi:hypothetical protein